MAATHTSKLVAPTVALPPGVGGVRFRHPGGGVLAKSCSAEGLCQTASPSKAPPPRPPPRWQSVSPAKNTLGSPEGALVSPSPSPSPENGRANSADSLILRAPTSSHQVQEDGASPEVLISSTSMTEVQRVVRECLKSYSDLETKITTISGDVAELQRKASCQPDIYQKLHEEVSSRVIRETETAQANFRSEIEDFKEKFIESNKALKDLEDKQSKAINEWRAHWEQVQSTFDTQSELATSLTTQYQAFLRTRSAGGSMDEAHSERIRSMEEKCHALEEKYQGLDHAFRGFKLDTEALTGQCFREARQNPEFVPERDSSLGMTSRDLATSSDDRDTSFTLAATRPEDADVGRGHLRNGDLQNIGERSARHVGDEAPQPMVSPEHIHQLQHMVDQMFEELKQVVSKTDQLRAEVATNARIGVIPPVIAASPPRIATLSPQRAFREVASSQALEQRPHGRQVSRESPVQSPMMSVRTASQKTFAKIGAVGLSTSSPPPPVTAASVEVVQRGIPFSAYGMTSPVRAAQVNPQCNPRREVERLRSGRRQSPSPSPAQRWPTTHNSISVPVTPNITVQAPRNPSHGPGVGTTRLRDPTVVLGPLVPVSEALPRGSLGATLPCSRGNRMQVESNT